MKTLEHCISLVVPNGSRSVKVDTIALPAGKIGYVAAFFRDYSVIQRGFVRAEIKDVNGVEISQLQSIENYRDREAGYLAGKKPIEMNGSSSPTIMIQATDDFTDDFLVDFVFVYDNEEKY